MIRREHPTLLCSLSIITLLELCVMLSATRHKLVKFQRSLRVKKGIRLKTANKSRKVHSAAHPSGLTYWRLRVGRTLLDQDTDGLVGQLGDYVRGSLVDGNTVPIECDYIQVWKHGAATWNTQEMAV